MDYTDVLSRIKPTEEESAHLVRLQKQLKSLFREHKSVVKFDFEVAFGGSTAKDTNLRGSSDIDVFIRCKTQEKNLSDAIETLIESIASESEFEYERVHGSRDYFTFTYDGSMIEVVPVKYVESIEDVENVTDMSPLHVTWASNHLTPELCDGVRLAKQFCKSAGVYGAESYINGLSGHVLEILIIHYGGFDAFIRAVASWQGVTVIDTQHNHEDVFTSLNQAKLNSPLIVVDPVDPNRNAAAAMSKDCYDTLIARAKAFLLQPAIDFFVIKKFDVTALQQEKQSGEDLFVVTAIPFKGKDDVVLTKVFKLYQFLLRQLALHEFMIRDSGWHPNKKESSLYFFVETTPLSEHVIREGPPSSKTADVNRFQAAHEEAFEKDGKWYASIPREFTTAKDCLNALLEQEYVSQRARDAYLQEY